MKARINIAAAGLLAFINSVFVIKYSYRFLQSWSIAAVAALLYLVVGLAAFSYFQKKSGNIIRKFSEQTYYKILLSIGVALTAVLVILPEDSQVSRLAAINEWLGNALNGIFPYHTAVNPSGFPGLFLLALPFYLIGKAGLLSAAGVIAAGLVFVKSEAGAAMAIRKFFLLLIMPAVLYELLVRSELLFNTSLALLAVELSLKLIEQRKPNYIIVLAALLTGIVLSTRLVIWIYWGISILFYYRKNIGAITLYAQTSVLGFIATILPFYIWRPTEFLAFGPFSVQSVYLPVPVLLSAPFIIAALTMLPRNKHQFFLLTGAVLFILVLISFCVHISEHGLAGSFTSKPFFDISYFIFSIPFLLLSIDLEPESVSLSDRQK